MSKLKSFICTCIVGILIFTMHSSIVFAAAQDTGKPSSDPSLSSKMISDLKSKLEKGDSTALDKFWDEINQKGTPLIEKIEGDTENCLVTFIYKGNKDTKNIIVLPETGAYSAENSGYLENKMENLLNTNLWYRSYKVRNDVRFVYYFSVNDALNDDIDKRYENQTNDPLNKNFVKYSIFQDSYVVMPEAEKFIWVDKREGVKQGKLAKHTYHNDKLVNKDRNIWIYTPNGYSKTHKPYEYLLLTDGQDYINTLSAKNILDNLISEKKIPPIVVIFVETSKNRGKEMMCSDTFSTALAKEIVPWVRKSYKISSKPEESIIGGLSLGGLNATYTALKHSNTFGKVLSQSASVWYNSEEKAKTGDCWMATQYLSTSKLKLKFFMTVGICEDLDMIMPNRTLKDALISKGYSLSYEEIKCGHDYLGWGEALAKGLIYLTGK